LIDHGSESLRQSGLYDLAETTASSSKYKATTSNSLSRPDRLRVELSRINRVGQAYSNASCSGRVLYGTDQRTIYRKSKDWVLLMLY